MAEALSVAASGIAIAQVTGQVGKSVLKLKKLLDAFGSRLTHDSDSAINTVFTTAVESTAAA